MWILLLITEDDAGRPRLQPLWSEGPFKLLETERINVAGPKSHGWLVSVCTFLCRVRWYLLLAFSKDVAMCARTRDPGHVQARQLPDYQLQMQDWDRHPPPTVPAVCSPGLHTLSLIYSLAQTAAFFVLRWKGQHFVSFSNYFSLKCDDCRAETISRFIY